MADWEAMDAERQRIQEEALRFAMVGLYRYRFDGTILDLNEAAFEILGLADRFGSPTEVIGRNIEDLIVYLGPRGRVRALIKQRGEARNVLYPFRTMAGVDKLALHDSFPVVEPTTGEEVVQAIIRDVTEEHKARESLKENAEQLQVQAEELRAQNEELLSQDAELRRLAGVAERRAAELQAVLENMVDAVFVCDSQGQVILVNEAGARLLGLASAEEAKRALAEFPDLLHVRHPDGRPELPEEMPLARALAGETVFAQPEVFTRPGTGRDVYLLTSAGPIRDAQGKIVGAVAVPRDVTELTELDRLKDQFIAVAAHELKTPVTIMKGYAQALARTGQAPTPAQHKMLYAIDRGADRIERIINDLLDISKLQTGSLELRGERVDLPQLVGEVADRLALTTTKHRIQITRAQPVVVQADRHRLEQVLSNLLDNAVRYSPAGGDVDVAVRLQGDEAIVSVADEGVGIPAEKQDRIFQRFYRAHTNTPYDYGGMGVGLYICKEIVERHGGRMWFESEEGVGSRFYFALPLGGDRALG